MRPSRQSTSVFIMGAMVASAWASLAAPAVAATGYVREFFFDVDGVLPSDDPDTEYVTSGEFIAEEDAFAVSGGHLIQTTMGRVGRAYYQSASSPGFVPTLPIEIEARIRVNSISVGRSTGPALTDGSHQYSFFLNASGAIVVEEGAAETQVDFDIDEGGDFHVFRITSPANSNAILFYRDDVLLFTGSAYAIPENQWSFGDGAWGAQEDANVDWDYVIFRQEADSVPTSRASWARIKALYR